MKLSTKQYAQALYQATTESKPQDAPELIKRFIGLLKSHQALSKLEQIMFEFERCQKRAAGITEALIETALPLTAGQSDSLTKTLSQAIGGKVIVSHQLNAELIGGLKLRYDDFVIDGSLSMQLRRLKHLMTDTNN